MTQLYHLPLSKHRREQVKIFERLHAVDFSSGRDSLEHFLCMIPEVT